MKQKHKQKNTTQDLPFKFCCEDCGIEKRYKEKKDAKSEVQKHKNLDHIAYWFIEDPRVKQEIISGR